eukprot:maker-scaffold270_size230592-snap-gene-1.23 protein:Tk10977 transcript:maker-scaffold270_size230592-snap-gene-1.23-mRNA-1 annotation:"GJ23366"
MRKVNGKPHNSFGSLKNSVKRNMAKFTTWSRPAAEVVKACSAFNRLVESVINNEGGHIDQPYGTLKVIFAQASQKQSQRLAWALFTLVSCLTPVESYSNMFAVDGNPEQQEECVRIIYNELAPRFNEFGSSVLHEQIEPVIQHALDASTKDVDENQIGGPEGRRFHFTHTDLGSHPPRISDIRAHSRSSADGSQKEAVIVDFKVQYLGDCNLQVRLLGIKGGVRDVQIEGRARLVMTPTLNALPFVGGFQLCFLDEPRINFDLEGLANICDWPGLRRKVRREILEDTSKRCVYPNRISIGMGVGQSDVKLVKGFNPTAMLFVRVSLGATHHFTTVVKNNCNPEWPIEQWHEFPLETMEGHYLILRAYDEDSLSRDEFLGRSAVQVKDILREPTFTTSFIGDDSEKSKYDEVSGDVTIEARWMRMYPDGTHESILPNQGSVAYCSVFVYSVNNLIEDLNATNLESGLPTTRLIFNYEEKTMKSSWEKNDPHPRYETGANFPLRYQDIEENGAVSITIMTKDDVSLCEMKLPFKTMIEEPLMKRMIQIEPDLRPHLTMMLSAEVKFLRF